MNASMHLDNVAPSKVVTEERRVHGGRHQDHVQVGKSLHHVMQQHQQEVSLTTNNHTRRQVFFLSTFV